MEQKWLNGEGEGKEVPCLKLESVFTYVTVTKPWPVPDLNRVSDWVLDVCRAQEVNDRSFTSSGSWPGNHTCVPPYAFRVTWLEHSKKNTKSTFPSSRNSPMILAIFFFLYDVGEITRHSLKHRRMWLYRKKVSWVKMRIQSGGLKKPKWRVL